jgi:sugar phosphate permease
MTINGLNKKNNNIYILSLIFLKYEDYYLLRKIFKYLKEMYGLTQK